MKYVLMMLLATSASAETTLVPVFNDDCLKEKVKACGDMKITHKPPYTEEEQKVIMCRIDAILQCREGTKEVKN